MTKVDKLLQWQPRAIDIRLADECPDCKQKSLLFYSLPELDNRVWFTGVRSMILGGYYCPSCDFSASGAMQKSIYMDAPYAQPHTAG